LLLEQHSDWINTFVVIPGWLPSALGCAHDCRGAVGFRGYLIPEPELRRPSGGCGWTLVPMANKLRRAIGLITPTRYSQDINPD